MISQLNVNDCHNVLNTGHCSKRKDIKKKEKKVLFDIITTFDLFTLTVFFALNYYRLHLMDFLSFIISLAFTLKVCFVGV